MNTTTAAVDLAKNVFAVCMGDAHGHEGKLVTLKRNAFLPWLRTLPEGTPVAMEACGSAHHWARTMQALGLVPRIMAAEFVKPYRKNQRVKNDARDAEAILAALHAPRMRFVTVKTEAQQQRLCWHRLREGWKAERTALLNRIRGLLAELGIVSEVGAAKLRRVLAELLIEQDKGTLSAEPIRLMVQSVLSQMQALDTRIAECDQQIARQSEQDPVVNHLQKCPSVGPLIADALVASVGDARHFKNGRQFAASLGITPGQHSSGGKARYGKITRRGDAYLRGLLVHSAGSVLNAALRLYKATPDKLNRLQRWMVTALRAGRLRQSQSRHCQQTRPTSVGHAQQRRGVQQRSLAPMGSGACPGECSGLPGRRLAYRRARCRQRVRRAHASASVDRSATSSK
ncbi:MAG: transposase [Rhodocyclales bacterium]|nr:transposase [Rhodocyclales bacterium]